ncbi:olfactory receptor 1C1-like [Bombina bombina]|uniref:olfactory receptor 1C1-like n=1 Tax=Bombina bombina TaxID=8345 RepID=UPI00235A67BA|nr:olfactory receptor 1C1-like [Bombina bombina]
MMDNKTFHKDFNILAFSTNSEKHHLFIVFLLIYLTGILGNLIIIAVILMDSHLHTPMYFFLCNLSFVDICYTTVTLPKLMDILLTGNNSMSFIDCFTQLYFFIFIGSIEVLLLSSMAYERYIAICNPLQYHLIMHKKKLVLLLVGIWIYGCGNSMFVTIVASNLNLCHSNTIQQFFCNVKALANISCSEQGFNIIIYVETLLLGLSPLLLSLTSYAKILKIIVHIKSDSGRKQTFSTCTSHLIVLFLFYGTILCMYMRPPSKHTDVLDQMFSVLYAAVAPMLNPLIYSLRNKEVKSAMMRIVTMKN